MNEQVKETILERIKKLQAMQESANELGNDHEAAAFAAKAQDLLMKHKLEMSEVEDFDIHDDITIDRDHCDWEDAGIPRSGKTSHWLAHLGYHVSLYNGCSVATVRGSNSIIIFGTEESRNIVNYILSVLARFGKNSCDKAYRKEYYKAKKEGEAYLMKGFKRAFLSAYVNTIGKRLSEANKEQLSEVTERGLMVLDAEAQALKDFLESEKLGTGRAFAGSRNAAGREAGAAAGNEANIGYNALGSDGSRVKNLN